MYNEDLEDQRELTEIVGVVRRGEDFNPFVGSNSWNKERGRMNYVNLRWLAAYKRFLNFESASTAYVERMVETLDEEGTEKLNFSSTFEI